MMTRDELEWNETGQTQKKKASPKVLSQTVQPNSKNQKIKQIETNQNQGLLQNAPQIKDLRTEDKMKIAKIITTISTLTTDIKKLENEKNFYLQKVSDLENNNTSIVKESAVLKSKCSQSAVMLKMYQEKMKEILEQKSSQEQELKKQLEALIRRQKKIAKTEKEKQKKLEIEVEEEKKRHGRISQMLVDQINQLKLKIADMSTENQNLLSEKQQYEKLIQMQEKKEKELEVLTKRQHEFSLTELSEAQNLNNDNKRSVSIQYSEEILKNYESSPSKLQKIPKIDQKTQIPPKIELEEPTKSNFDSKTELIEELNDNDDDSSNDITTRDTLTELQTQEDEFEQENDSVKPRASQTLKKPKKPELSNEDLAEDEEISKIRRKNPLIPAYPSEEPTTVTFSQSSIQNRSKPQNDDSFFSKTMEILSKQQKQQQIPQKNIPKIQQQSPFLSENDEMELFEIIDMLDASSQLTITKNKNNLNKNPQNFNQNSQNFNQNPQNFTQNSQNFNQNPQNFTQNSQNFNQNSQNFNQNPQNFNQNSQNFNQNPQKLNNYNNFMQMNHSISLPSAIDGPSSISSIHVPPPEQSKQFPTKQNPYSTQSDSFSAKERRRKGDISDEEFNSNQTKSQFSSKSFNSSSSSQQQQDLSFLKCKDLVVENNIFDVLGID